MLRRRSLPRRSFLASRILLALSPLVLCCARPALVGSSPQGSWVGTWEASPQLVEPRNLPPAPGLTGSTLRQVVHVSLGGSRLRLRLSNEFGNGPVRITSVHLAPSLGGSTIGAQGDLALTFDGSSSVEIPQGASILSDPLDCHLVPLSNVAVTMHFVSAPRDLTGHPGSRTTSYLVTGDRMTAPELPDASRTEHWYIIDGMEVFEPTGGSAAIVTLGNSITDGRGSGTDRNDRWPDDLASRLHEKPATAHLAVLNAGIGGNCVVASCLGPPALDRLDRDVLDRPGVRWVIVLEGVNDIGNARGSDSSAAVARKLISAYRQIIARAHARHLRVYGATILPFGSSFYDSPDHESARQTVNQWIRTSRAFDAVIDLDAALRDPAHPARLRPEADSGDHLHPNEIGYHMIADAIDPGLFTS